MCFLNNKKDKMMKIMNHFKGYAFSHSAKIIVSNSNSIYFNLAFEEYLFESSRYHPK